LANADFQLFFERVSVVYVNFGVYSLPIVALDFVKGILFCTRAYLHPGLQRSIDAFLVSLGLDGLDARPWP